LWSVWRQPFVSALLWHAGRHETKNLELQPCIGTTNGWEISDYQDNTLISAAKRSHRDYTFGLIEKLEQHGYQGFMVGASFCSLCAPCAITEGKPCTFPQRQYSCMSAYCIYVKDLADKCGMTYTYKMEFAVVQHVCI